MAGNKKEIIRELKLRLEICNAKRILAEEALAPVAKQSTQRGARMQLMYEHMYNNTYDASAWFTLPHHMHSWFNKDGSPVL